MGKKRRKGVRNDGKVSGLNSVKRIEKSPDTFLLSGMPPLWVYEGSDGVLLVYNGVTRAVRIAKLAPGTLIRVEVIGRLPKAYASATKIGDLLP